MKKHLLAAAAALTVGSTAFAADISGIDTTALNDGSATVMIPINFAQAGSSVDALDLQITYDTAELTYNNPAGPCPGSTIGATSILCNENVAGTILISGFVLGSTFADGVAAELTFDVAAVADGTQIEPTIAVTNCTAGQTCNVVPTPNADTGSFEILANPLPPASTLTSSADVALAAAVNGPAATGNYTLTASGGAVSGVSCAADAGDTQITYDFSGVPASIADAGTGSITASCSGAAAAAGLSRGFTCNYTDSASMAQTVSGTTTCDIIAGLPVVGVTPPNGGTLSLGPVGPGGSITGNVIFSETSNGGTGYTVDSCTLTTADTNLTLSGVSSGAVASGGSLAIPVSVSGATGAETGTIDCTLTVDSTTQAYSASIVVFLQALTVPTLSQWAMILMGLVLVGFGAFRLRKGGMAA